MVCPCKLEAVSRYICYVTAALLDMDWSVSVMSQIIDQSEAAGFFFEGSAPENMSTGLLPDGLVK